MAEPTPGWRAWATRMIAEWEPIAAAVRRDPSPGAQMRAACIDSTIASMRNVLIGQSPPKKLPTARHQMDLFA